MRVEPAGAAAEVAVLGNADPVPATVAGYFAS
jgi:hypothetical protein